MSSNIRHRLCKSQLDALASISTHEAISEELFMTVPAAKYVDPAQFEVEKAAFFFREPILVGPSAYLPKPNMHFQQEILGVPLLVTRDKEGVVRAFVNACRHR